MERPTGRRRLAAILMADVVEYGRHMGEDEAGTIRTLKAHRAVFSNHIQQGNGRVVDAKGDAIMAEFASVVDAVAAAVEIQREIGHLRTRDLARPSASAVANARTVEPSSAP